MPQKAEVRCDGLLAVFDGCFSPTANSVLSVYSHERDIAPPTARNEDAEVRYPKLVPHHVPIISRTTPLESAGKKCWTQAPPHTAGSSVHAPRSRHVSLDDAKAKECF